MAWDLGEALSYFRQQGAPRDQNALIGLLREIQSENGGSIPGYIPEVIGNAYGIKESFVLAVIKRIPSLRLGGSHCLELCAGPSCAKHVPLAACAEALRKETGSAFSLKYVPCMRQCGKGPNIRWDGKLYNGATEELLQKLAAGSRAEQP